MTDRPSEFLHAGRVDPFLGNAESDLPPPHGEAATWWCAKPAVGNTHPGATWPFGMVSACAYSGAYVTGYGRYGLSLEGGPPPVAFDRHEALGIAHFQQSGTGRIRMYYNYLLTTPLGGRGLKERTTRRELADERAWPGYYAASLPDLGVRFEVAATERGARHLYHFPADAEAAVAVDVSAGGLRLAEMETYPQRASFRIQDDGSVAGEVVMEGIPIQFHCRCPGGTAFLWFGEEELAAKRYEMALDTPKARPALGYGFKGPQTMELSFGFSLGNPARARTASMIDSGFEAAVTAAARSWESMLSKIEVEGGTDSQHEVFATALYHSLIKPAEFRDENPFTRRPGPFFLDLSTLWDLYRTQLPLMMTLWPERGADFVTFLCEVAEREGAFPVSYLMDNAPDRFTKQATGLCHAILEDARIRGIKGDWNRALSLMWKTASSGNGRFGEYQRSHLVSPLSHTLDIAYAHFCTARMARALGHQLIHDKSQELSVHWRNAFDPATGLLREDSTYYEGENWNYSFRLLHEMAARIKLAGGERAFLLLLDKFFGFVEPANGERVYRFEGLNNEPDMETPFAYLYAGRHDRTARVVRSVMDYQYTTGRGGLAGNDDSGALSSWYVWNATGLFPVCGQPVILIGSPLFERAAWHLPDGDFIIEAVNQARENVFVRNATLNGAPIRRAWLRMEEFRGGGVLRLEMGDEPSDFGNRERPPVFPA